MATKQAGTFMGSNCPRCNAEIGPENRQTGLAICGSCGWTDPSQTIHSAESNERKSIAIMVFMGLVMVLSFGHLVSWGSYAFQAPFMKLGEMTGMISKQGLHELADACVHLNKWACAKNAYLGIYKSKGDVEGIAELAYLQARLNETEAALSTYASYVKLGGKDGESLLRYGKLLEVANRTEDSIRMYEASIAARPELLPVQATTAIVRLLIKQGKYVEARERIVSFHGSAGNAKGFLNTELTQIENWFAAKGKRAGTPSIGKDVNG